MRGADLMLSGILGDLSDSKRKEKRVVRIVNVNVPVGVGKVLIQGSEDLVRSGKGLEVFHIYSDQLWAFGSKTHPPTEVSIESECSEQVETPEDEELKDENENPVLVDTQTHGDVQALNEELADSKISTDTLNTGSMDNGPSDHDSTTLEDDTSQEGTETEISSMTPDEMDTLMQDTLLQSLHKKLKDKDLPILVANFWNEYFLPCRPLGKSIVVKRSNYKKFNIFLNHMAEEGLLKLEEKKPGAVQIMEVNRQLELYQLFKPIPVSMTHDVEKEVVVDDKKLAIEEFWRLPKNLYFLVPEDEEIPERMILSEANKILWDYVSHMNCIIPDAPKYVQLNESLARAFYGRKSVNERVEKKELATKFKNKLLLMHEIEIDGEVLQKKGKVGNIHVFIERRAGNKVVSRISGVHNFGLNPKDVGKELSKHYAASAGYKKYISGMKEGKKELTDIIIQGNLTKTIADFFSNQFKIDRKYIIIEGKK